MNLMANPPQPRIATNRIWRLLEISLVGRGMNREFAVPSAGAIYPYDFDICILTGEGQERFAAVTLDRLGALLEKWTRQDASGLSLTLNFRPKIAMWKYGERGITYGIQDCGHVLTNVQICAACLGLTARMVQHDYSDEIAADAPLPDRTAMFSLHLTSPVSSSLSDRVRPHDAGRQNRLLTAMQARRSARAFAARPCPTDIISATLIEAWQIAVQFGIGSDAFRFSLGLRRGHDDWMLSSAQKFPDIASARAKHAHLDPEPLFCDQRFTTDASGILFISAPLGTRTEVLDQSLRLGQLGQCLYLAAEMNGIGACCVGGFHYDDAVDVFALTDGHYAAYAMLLGPLGPRIKKVDRAQRPSPRSAIIPFPAYSRSDTNAST